MEGGSTVKNIIQGRVKEYAKLLQYFNLKKIVFWGFDEKEEYCYSVDGVHFEADEFTMEPSSKWYTFKHNCGGLVIMYGSINTGDVEYVKLSEH